MPRLVSPRSQKGLWGLALLVASTACQPRNPDSGTLTVFAAASLGPTLYAMARTFEARNPGTDIRIELSGSRLACSKISEQGRAGDVVLSADFHLIDSMLRPEHAAFNLLFASNALVLAYSDHSAVQQELRSGVPWQQALARPEVRVGIANPALAPVGYRAILALQLNDRTAAEDLRLGAVIRDNLRPEYQRPDVIQLIAPLEAGEVDAAFVYRTEALLHGLPFVELAKEINFSDPDLQDLYRSAAHTLVAVGGEPARTVRGSAVVYGLTVPRTAPNVSLAERWIEFMLSSTGRAAAAKNHLHLLTPDERRVSGEPPVAFARLAQKT